MMNNTSDQSVFMESGSYDLDAPRKFLDGLNLQWEEILGEIESLKKHTDKEKIDEIKDSIRNKIIDCEGVLGYIIEGLYGLMRAIRGESDMYYKMEYSRESGNSYADLRELQRQENDLLIKLIDADYIYTHLIEIRIDMRKRVREIFKSTLGLLVYKDRAHAMHTSRKASLQKLRKLS